MSIDIGYKASAEQFGARALVELGVMAEARGFDTAVVSDHFQPWRHTGGHAPSSLVWMSAVGERTHRLQLGTSVLTPTFRYNPAVLAQTFATLAHLYPGRIMLGLGSGEALNEIAAGWNGAGSQPWPGFKERFARLRESIDIMRALWAGERVSFKGEYYSLHDATVYDRPGHLPIWIAGGGPRMAEFAGTVGDGYICTSGKGMELYTKSLLPAVERGRETGRAERPEYGRMIEIKISYDPDPDAALANTRFWAPLSLSPEQKHGLPDPVAIEQASDALSDEEVARRWIVSSDPDHAVEQVAPYVRAGFDRLVLHAPGHDQRRFLDLFATDLRPRLRRLA